MTENLLTNSKCSHKKLVLPMLNFDFSKFMGQINIPFFVSPTKMVEQKNGRLFDWSRYNVVFTHLSI